MKAIVGILPSSLVLLLLTSQLAAAQQYQTGGNAVPYTSPAPVAPDASAQVPPVAAPLADAAPDQDSTAGSSTNSSTAANQGVRPVVDLSGLPGCTRSAADSLDLAAGIGDTCTVLGVLLPRSLDAFSFSLPPSTNSTRPYRVLITLETTDGNANLGLPLPSGRAGSRGPDIVGTQVFESEVTTRQYIVVPWSFIRQQTLRTSDAYLIAITKNTGRLTYKLQVSTPYLDTRLAEPDTAAMELLMEACCPPDLDVNDPNSGSAFCRLLKVALDPRNQDEDDLCNTPPLMCNTEGRLTQLAAASTGLNCPNGLPADLSGLSALHTLDLSFNSLKSTVQQVAEVLSTLPALENVFLRYTDLRERLNCRVLASRNLKRLSLSGNGELVGEVPGCFFQSPTLEELYLSATSLTGRLPNTVPRNSSLKAFFGIRLTDSPSLLNLRASGLKALGSDPRQQGFTGPIPRSLLASPALQYLDLSNNSVSGGLSGLTAGSNLHTLNLSSNALDGKFPDALPLMIQLLDVSNNKLTGSLPADLSGYAFMTVMDVSSSQISGSFPSALPPNITAMNVSLNPKLGGVLPNPLPDSLLMIDVKGTNGLTVPMK